MRSWSLAALFAISGCQVIYPLEIKDAPTEATPDVLEIDAPVCTTPGTTCALNDTESQPLGCSLAPVTSCEPRLFDYCDCGKSRVTGGVVVLPNAANSNMTDIIYVSLAGLGSVSMSFKFNSAAESCAGSNAVTCDIDTTTCGGGGSNELRRWTVNLGAGQYTVKLFDDDITPPCNQIDTILTVKTSRP